MNEFVFPEGSVTLNDEQARIVRQPPTQNLRILASAGSGKTTTLTARIAHLLTSAGAGPSGQRWASDHPLAGSSIGLIALLFM